MSVLLRHTASTFICILLAGSTTAFAEEMWRTVDAFPAPEAKQAAAADDRFFFAITNGQIAKYDRNGKQRIAISTGEAQHLNSGFLWDGNLLCAHSNYPRKPEKSEVKLLNVDSMQISTFKDFGRSDGSLTWIVRHSDHWWCNFAKYGELNSQTWLAKFDDRWQLTDKWTYPKKLIDQLGNYSVSGGIWHNGELLVSGHDAMELYRLQLPKQGQKLEYLGKMTVPFRGQGFAVDPLSRGLIGIDRADRQVILIRTDEHE